MLYIIKKTEGGKSNDFVKVFFFNSKFKRAFSKNPKLGGN